MVNQACGSFRVKINLSNKLLLAKGSGSEGWCVIGTGIYTLLIIILYCSSQSCPTLCAPTDCSPPGSSVQGDSPSKNTGMGCHALYQGNLPNSGPPHCRWIHYQMSHQGSPISPKQLAKLAQIKGGENT